MTACMRVSCPSFAKKKRLRYIPHIAFLLFCQFLVGESSYSGIGKSKSDKLEGISLPVIDLDKNSTSIPKIQIISNDWGTGYPEDISAVLKSVAEIMFPLGGKPPYSNIMVGRSENGPIVLYKRGSKGQYLINLNSKDRYWCQYAFQFSHEIGHILCGFKDGDPSNLWFEETLGEVASLYSLLRMEEKWKHSAPYPHWKAYAPEFTKYARERKRKYKDQIPSNLKKWFHENQKVLAKHPVDRPRNAALAIQLLPRFENSSVGWTTCAYLNDQKNKEAKSFESYLYDWYRSCPHTEQKGFVKKIAAEFGITLASMRHSSED